ncbi:glycosyltransferase family 4 protein [Patescibacteria group bacterium]|nr:glycosyltransferase family 4 protein [Patescibacteria group bacterium]MBU1663373.1 glycosyltransferase family 4 protein [Patescibacteria group bacterium]MBU1934338.1 glycosyltransferase family 4 protein [Patescibacteria group bacterium]MBU2007615.1 glycosyltransferase family 4 protein [Patescibacteria group bacterium]MBU2233376.1 glycosyltransferase family 4 protein [Patescibacteria group bacterium]
MIIGIDASRANRKFKTGTEWYSYYLITELAKIDSKNQYILYTDKPLIGGLADLAAEDDSANSGEINKRGWQISKSPFGNFRVKILKWPFTYFWTQIRLSYEMLIHRVDILFIPAHTLPIIHPKKSIVTIHDIGFEHFAKLYSSDQIGPASGLTSKVLNFLAKLFTWGKFQPNILDYHRWSTKFALKNAKIIIAVSEFTKQELVELYKADAKKIKVIYNGFNGQLYRQISDQEKIKQVLNKYDIKTPYIFYVGRLEKKKNTAKLVEAYAIMRQKFGDIKHKLVLAGSAGFGFDEVKYIISEFNFEENIIITGWIPEADMPYIYNGAALFVFPSLYEGFGIPLLQAMACRVPIAASNTASIPEVVKNSALLFNPENKQDMAEKMAKLLLDKQLSGELVNRGFARSKDFSLAKCAQETLALMEKM